MGALGEKQIGLEDALNTGYNMRAIARLYRMLEGQDEDSFLRGLRAGRGVRLRAKHLISLSSFNIDPGRRIRTMVTYPYT